MDESLKLEHILTRYYAKIYGRDHVRGSVWVSLNSKPPTILNDDEISFLNYFGFHSEQQYQQTQPQVAYSQINFCPECGIRLEYNVNFCNECGLRLR